MENQPTINSFVIRFVNEDAAEGAGGGQPEAQMQRGFIRHVQSSQEIAFTHWDDAVSFVQRFVPLGIETTSKE